jgi:hypothetical protein
MLIVTFSSPELAWELPATARLHEPAALPERPVIPPSLRELPIRLAVLRPGG